MKKTIAVLNPIFAHLKYLLFTASLFLAAILVAQILLKNMNMDVAIAGDLKQTILPLLGTAALSMYLAKKFQGKKL